MNALLFQKSVYDIPNPTEAFVEYMHCAEDPTSSALSCWPLAVQLFPLKFWRNVTAETARATFGTIFFIVEITKGYSKSYSGLYLTPGISGGPSTNVAPLLLASRAVPIIHPPLQQLLASRN